MSDCRCNPSQFPFYCDKYESEMDYNAYQTCRGQLGGLARMQQEVALLKQLRTKECGHLGPIVSGEGDQAVHSCALYGQCTRQIGSDRDFQSCSVCPDHTALADLVTLPSAFADQFVPFSGTKGGTAGCETDGCTTLAGCAWGGSLDLCEAPNPFSLKCICVTIAAIDDECGCLEGDYILSTSLISGHTYGRIEDPKCDGPLSLQMDDSADPLGCIGCGDGAIAVLGVSCVYGTTTDISCIQLCGDETPTVNLSGRGIVCCGCIDVTATNC